VLELLVRETAIKKTIMTCGRLNDTLLRGFNPLKESTYDGDVREYDF
jgi:hypothetical protein